MNITHKVKVNDKYEEFHSGRTPNGPMQFCELMDGKGGDMGTNYVISNSYLDI